MIHSTADVSPLARIGSGTCVWRWTCVRPHATVGKDCNIGQCVYIDTNVTVGDGCKIQNGSNLYDGVVCEDHVFIGPSVTFTNVKKPRSAQPTDKRNHTIVRAHATIGANATIVCGVEIGERAFVGAGSVVTKDVPPGKLAIGVPARIVGDAPSASSAF